MRYIYIPIFLLLSACSKCDIPYGEYKSVGGTESMTTLVLNSSTYKLMFEHWKPTNYESRTKIIDQGDWSCNGRVAEIQTSNGKATAELKEIGKNPLGLPVSTKALVFNASSNDVLSKTILYTSESLKKGF